MESDNLYELRNANNEHLKAIKREKIFKSIFYLILALIVSTGLKDTDFKYPIVFSIIILIIGIVINISKIIKIEEKDKMLNEFFYEDYLLTLEKLINMNNYTYFTFEESKNELVNILIEISKRIRFLGRNTEYSINLETELNKYKITYKIISDGRKFENLLRIKILWQLDINPNKTERGLYLSIVNSLYKFRRKECKSFKILKIEAI